MLRIRQSTGQTQIIQGTNFVEICDEDGGIAAVVYKDAAGRIRILEPGEEQFSRYISMYASTGAAATKGFMTAE